VPRRGVDSIMVPVLRDSTVVRHTRGTASGLIMTSNRRPVQVAAALGAVVIVMGRQSLTCHRHGGAVVTWCSLQLDKAPCFGMIKRYFLSALSRTKNLGTRGEDVVSGQKYGGETSPGPVWNVLCERPIPLDLTVVIIQITTVQIRCNIVPRNREYKLHNIVDSLWNTMNTSSKVQEIHASQASPGYQTVSLSRDSSYCFVMSKIRWGLGAK
jgi:hypothetical protein